MFRVDFSFPYCPVQQRSRGLSVAATATATVAKPSREEIVKILRTCQAVCFDVDSTVIPEEGIDELAAFKGVGEEVAQWTRQ